MNPLVSVITDCYNAAGIISVMLDSVRAQTCARWKVWWWMVALGMARRISWRAMPICRANYSQEHGAGFFETIKKFLDPIILICPHYDR